MLFTFPSRYWFAIGHRRVFSLGGWSPLLRTGFHVSGPTRDGPWGRRGFAYGALTRCDRPFHAVPLPFRFVTPCGGANPRAGVPQPRRGNASPLTLAPVWASALSLAATRAISVDFSSSGYLDVSVPPVVPPRLCVQRGVAEHGPCWVSPFGDPRIEGRVRLPGDYRGLPRPSSTSCAKASAVRPRYLLLPSRSLRKSLGIKKLHSK